ncbi:MAG: HlyD family efflux transporter periplasmic adaptor subunit [Bacteroidetes bacterium]|nr:HlyD family efflux transporter periplasmic adaptor subunit [Bacteroidota bacterium]MDA1121293.1 HlyD family efflux transporter periplasmic adaptor subunit [Bacteroidota bacterium]
MQKIPLPILITALSLISACNQNENLADGYGYFEADETVISAQMPGELITFNISEGELLEEGVLIGVIDTMDLTLKREEIKATQEVIAANSTNIATQIEVLKSELLNLEREKKRLRNLVDAGAATTQQLDDINGKIVVINSQISNIQSQKINIKRQINSTKVQLAQIDEKIKKSKIVNPVNGTVLSKLAQVKEYTAPGKPLYKIASLEQLKLRVYVSGSQLSSVKIGNSYTIKIDGSDGELISYPGTMVWIASEAEFTPKSIQTKEERLDLVYAMKLSVKNDGRIKIGMPGELWLKETP